MKTAMKADADVVFNASQIDPLQFVNLSPSNPNTIHTALVYSSEECEKRRQKHCVVTFDLAIYVKAIEILAACRARGQLKNVIINLGGFHTLMNFMGGVGHIMCKFSLLAEFFTG